MTQVIRKTGRYEKLAELGRGANGVVYKARDTRIGRLVALKTIHPEAGLSAEQEQEFFERFHREALTAGTLTHPNIVTIYDIDEDPVKKISFISMEYIEGKSIQEQLDAGRVFTVEEALGAALQVADGLDYAHRNGVVHRDIKPANLIEDGDGRLIITDFSVARLASSDLTKSGQFLGTPYYIAPEQVAGGQVDSRSDIFSLTVVLYLLLTNERPFIGDNISTVLYKIVNLDPPPPSCLNVWVPEAVDLVVARGMARNPEERYQNAAAMREDLARLLRGETPATAAATVGEDDDQESITTQLVPDVLSRTAAAPPARQANRPEPEEMPVWMRLPLSLLDSMGKRPLLLGFSTMTLMVLILLMLGSLFSGPEEAANAVTTYPLITRVRRPTDAWFDGSRLTAGEEDLKLQFTVATDWEGYLDHQEEALLARERAEDDRRRAAYQARQQAAAAARKEVPTEEPVAAAESVQSAITAAGPAPVELPPPALTASLDLQIRHSFKSGTIHLRAAGEEIFSAVLGGAGEEATGVKKAFDTLRRKMVKSVNRFPGIAVESGRYPLELLLEVPEKEIAPLIVDADFAVDQGRCLTVTCKGVKTRKLLASWGCAE